MGVDFRFERLVSHIVICVIPAGGPEGHLQSLAALVVGHRALEREQGGRVQKEGGEGGGREREFDGSSTDRLERPC